MRPIAEKKSPIQFETVCQILLREDMEQLAADLKKEFDAGRPVLLQSMLRRLMLIVMRGSFAEICSKAAIKDNGFRVGLALLADECAEEAVWAMDEAISGYRSILDGMYEEIQDFGHDFMLEHDVYPETLEAF